MLTNNYKNWVNNILHNPTGGEFLNLTDVNGKFFPNFILYWKDEKSRTLDKAFKAVKFEDITQGNIVDNIGSIFIGSGTKEESQEDIALNNIVPDSDLLYISANATFFSEYENKFIFTETYKYIGADNITVNETAFYKILKNQTDQGFNAFCFARQKIEPLTVSTGDVFTVTMVIG